MTGTTIQLIVAADEPALFFSSVDAAERKLEWIDVRDGVYPIAYDPEGNVYRLRHEGQRVIVERDGDLNDPKGLNALLKKFIAAVQSPVISEDNIFLLSLCTRYIER